MVTGPPAQETWDIPQPDAALARDEAGSCLLA
jgi:hypothetical protein